MMAVADAGADGEKHVVHDGEVARVIVAGEARVRGLEAVRVELDIGVLDRLGVWRKLHARC